MYLLDRMLRQVMRRGVLEIIYADGTARRYGEPAEGWPEVTVRFTDARVPGYIARHPRLGIAEMIMDGRAVFERGDVWEMIHLVRRNAPFEDGGPLNRGGYRGLARKIFGTMGRLNDLARSRRNVAHHYNLDERLYRLFLDDDMQYSCAYFADPADGLERAQADKKRHIAAKLALAPGQRVLDIGCGWGGMALYLNRAAGVEVLGVTLSEEQLRVARRRADEAGVADRVKFELIDYREVRGRFDRIVSVGMFEHVGVPHYPEFFAKCRDLLADDGVMLLHTIGRIAGPGTTDAFTSKYIFPGGYNPALSEVVTASEPSRLVLTDVEVLRLHYALTIEHWYRRTVSHRAEIEALYDARFYRMWTFYLAGAASAFRYGGLVNYQLQYAREREALPITRDYVGAAEAGLAR